MRLHPLLLPLLAAPLACAQAGERTVQSWQLNGNRLEVAAGDGRYLFSAYSDKIVETTFIPSGAQHDPVSHAVVLQPGAAARVRESDQRLVFETAGMAVTIERAPLRISYSYRGKPLIAEKAGFHKVAGGQAIDFALDREEVIYGGGGRVVGLNRRGYRFPLYNKAHYGYETHSEQVAYSLPLAMSSRLYAVHLDNPQRGFLDVDSKYDGTLAFETIGGRATYQVIAGDSWADLIGEFTALTGRQPLPPRWALGNISSRFGYHSEAEARTTVDKYIAAGIPLDAMIFDIYWYGVDMKGRVGNLAWVKEKFPDAPGMMRDFAAKGVQTIVSLEPYIMTTSNRWREAVDRQVFGTGPDGKPLVYDVYFGNTGLIDIFKPEAQAWFWERYKALKAEGVAGCFCDLGEPEGHPSEMRHATGSADQVHNLYGHEWARMMAEGYRRDYPDQRPFHLARAGYSGSQRYGLIPSSGDSNRTWGGLRGQPELSLSMGLQGVGWMHSDLGGFAGPNPDDELYTRWMQYGVFQPLYRPHGQEEVPSEPVYRDAATMARVRDAVRLRYRFLPYNYTLAFDNNQTGLPLMRPLMFEEPDNEALRTVADSFLWGDDVLVAPVTAPKAGHRMVYFPKRGPWFDFYDGRRFEGASAHAVGLHADRIPVFVRAGAFIPLVEPVQSTRDYSLARFALHYYHDRTVRAGQGKLYDDDGKTPGAFEKGQYELLRFASRLGGSRLDIDVNASAGSGKQPGTHAITLVVHNVGAAPRSATLDGKALKVNWERATGTLTLELPASSAARRRIQVSLAAADAAL